MFRRGTPLPNHGLVHADIVDVIDANEKKAQTRLGIVIALYIQIETESAISSEAIYFLGRGMPGRILIHYFYYKAGQLLIAIHSTFAFQVWPDIRNDYFFPFSHLNICLLNYFLKPISTLSTFITNNKYFSPNHGEQTLEID